MNFSLLMSVYDKEKPDFLRECLESVFNSSLLPTETIIVEDGSINSELKFVIEEFKNKYNTIK